MVCFSFPVLREFLLTCPGERGRLWEVEPPGAWGQRVNIWLKVYLQKWRLQDGEWDRHLLRGSSHPSVHSCPKWGQFHFTESDSCSCYCS